LDIIVKLLYKNFRDWDLMIAQNYVIVMKPTVLRGVMKTILEYKKVERGV